MLKFNAFQSTPLTKAAWYEPVKSNTLPDIQPPSSHSGTGKDTGGGGHIPDPAPFHPEPGTGPQDDMAERGAAAAAAAREAAASEAAAAAAGGGSGRRSRAGLVVGLVMLCAFVVLGGAAFAMRDTIARHAPEVCASRITKP